MNCRVKSRVNKETGGTIIGLIIGLVIGLGIAVVVAVMITKTPTPFTNKLGMTKPADLPVQITDPNKPLYGNAYKEPPPDRPIMERPERSNANAPQDFPDSLDTADAEPVPQAVKSTVEKNPLKTAEKNVPAKKAADEKAAFYLQVGAFRNQSDAENVRAKLALIDVESKMSEKNSEGDNLYRVRIGPFNSVDEMNRMRSKLVENSIDVAVIKTPK